MILPLSAGIQVTDWRVSLAAPWWWWKRHKTLKNAQVQESFKASSPKGREQRRQLVALLICALFTKWGLTLQTAPGIFRRWLAAFVSVAAALAGGRSLPDRPLWIFIFAPRGCREGEQCPCWPVFATLDRASEVSKTLLRFNALADACRVLNVQHRVKKGEIKSFLWQSRLKSLRS